MFNIKKGTVVSGRYKRPGRQGIEVKLEVTAVVNLPTRFGRKPYLFGVRTDPERAGVVQYLPLERFYPSSLAVTEARGFRPVELDGWYVMPATSRTLSVEKLDADDLAFEPTAKPLTDFEVVSWDYDPAAF